jgi:anti-anti-sigma factor
VVFARGPEAKTTRRHLPASFSDWKKMEIKISESGGACVVSVAGKLDALSAIDYEKAMNQLIADGKTRFVVDFSELSYISSAGLRVLLSTAKKLKPLGGLALFAKLQGNVLEVIEMTGFGTILGIHDSVDSALAAL